MPDVSQCVGASPAAVQRTYVCTAMTLRQPSAVVPHGVLGAKRDGIGLRWSRSALIRRHPGSGRDAGTLVPLPQLSRRKRLGCCLVVLFLDVNHIPVMSLAVCDAG